MKSHRKKIVFAVVLLLLLVGSYFLDNSNSSEKTIDHNTEESNVEIQISENKEQAEIVSNDGVTSQETPPAEEKIETQTEEKSELYCTITIKCDTILNNMNLLDESKHILIPSDGIILSEKKVVFNEGESVFDVLQRETRNNGIHMEFVQTPIYDSAYIEGIHNLYEFDCGELSGWMYSVNGWFPNYGCSNYILKDGDSIEWVYTCNLGKDVQ